LHGTLAGPRELTPALRSAAAGAAARLLTEPARGCGSRQAAAVQSVCRRLQL